MFHRTTAEELRQSRDRGDLEIRLDLDGDSDVSAIAAALRTFKNTVLPLRVFRLLVGGGPDPASDLWRRAEANDLMEAISSIESIRSLEIMHSHGVAPSSFLTTLVKRLRLHVLSIYDCTIEGSTTEHDELCAAISSQSHLTRCIMYGTTLRNTDTMLEESFDRYINALSLLPSLNELSVEISHKGGSQYLSTGPLHNLLFQSKLATLRLGHKLFLKEEALLVAAQFLKHSHGLRKLVLRVNHECSAAALRFLARAFETNTHLESFQLLFFGDISAVVEEHFLIQFAEALKGNRRSSLQKVVFRLNDTLTSPYANAALCRMLETNYQIVSFRIINFAIDEKSIDLYIRMNRKGRKRVMKNSENMSRKEYTDFVAQFTYDYQCLYYCLHTFPGLFQPTRTLPPTLHANTVY